MIYSRMMYDLISIYTLNNYINYIIYNVNSVINISDTFARVELEYSYCKVTLVRLMYNCER